MQASKASTTALGAALMRALHTRSDPAPVLDDPWGDRLVPGEVVDSLYQRVLAALPPGAPPPPRAGAVDALLKSNAAYANVVLRSRRVSTSSPRTRRSNRSAARSRRPPFDRAATSYFSWLGVSMYLTLDANMSALRSIAERAAPGSELVFTYFDDTSSTPASATVTAMASATGATGT